LGRKEREVLKEGESEWSRDRSAASDRDRWNDTGKNSATAGRKCSTIGENIYRLRLSP
jgi:hypothetical protein